MPDSLKIIKTDEIVYFGAEQPLPPYGCCNLGSLDITKFVVNGKLDYGLLQKAIEIAVRTLDRVIDVNNYPVYEIEKWAKENRPIGLGIMGWADYLLMLKVAYGSKESIEELEKVLAFIYSVAVTESVRLGKELGIPTQCKKLPTPRRNITVMTIAPTGTISLIAGCSSGIEPIFSEITIRNDKTGSYQFEHDLANQSYFRCAVAANGAKEVTWDEHVNTLAAAQRHIDSGVSKTCNVPQNTRRETIERILFSAWENQCKGITIYRNNSRQIEVLSPKELKKNKCPQCGKDLVTEGHCQKCSDPECGYSLCNI